MALDHFDLPTTYVDTPEKLQAALPLWHAAGVLSVDIECSLTGMHHCVLALLQVATHDQAWLVDPIPLEGLMRPALQAMAQPVMPAATHAANVAAVDITPTIAGLHAEVGMGSEESLKKIGLLVAAPFIGLAYFLALPFVRVGGESAVRFDMPSLTLHVFGAALAMNEFFVLLPTTILVAFLFLLVTAAFMLKDSIPVAAMLASVTGAA